MDSKTGKAKTKGETYDCGKDFEILSDLEKRGILKTARALLRVQRKDAERIEGASISPKAKEK